MKKQDNIWKQQGKRKDSINENNEEKQWNDKER